MPSILRLAHVVFTVIAFPAIVLAVETPAVPMNERPVVAAGFGFQDESVSFITVKTYDAQTGNVLSSETYELDIKDDGPPSSHPHARIFAGGVGAGTGNLSEFTLRVYDASNGRFLWEGHLNLTARDHPEAATQRVAAVLRPRLAISKVALRLKDVGQPHFVLRAVNPRTGYLVWSDEFSTDVSPVRMERISRSVIGMTGNAPRDIDFRIKMPDQTGRQWLWEDKIEPTDDSEETAPEESDDPRGFSRRDRQPMFRSSTAPADAPSTGIQADRRRERVRLASPLPGFVFS